MITPRVRARRPSTIGVSRMTATPGGGNRCAATTLRPNEKVLSAKATIVAAATTDPQRIAEATAWRASAGGRALTSANHWSAAKYAATANKPATTQTMTARRRAFGSADWITARVRIHVRVRRATAAWRCACRGVGPHSPSHLPEKPRIGTPQRPCERGGECDPGKVRRQQQCGWSTDAPEPQRGCQNEYPKQQNFGKCRCTMPPGKEKPTPQGIGYQLCGEET